MKINLHLHSNYSLGSEFGANELIEKFKKENFDIISIADHNTCEAYKEISYNDDMKIITGIEADAMVNNHTYEFLCYDFDLDKVQEFALEKYETVEKRQIKIFNELVKICKTKNIQLNNVDTYNPSNEYAHAAVYRMLDNEFLNEHNILSISGLYRLSIINEEFPLFIDMHIVCPDIKELLEIIHNNNGKVFLAHPFKYKRPVKGILNEVKDLIDGIEISNNPKNKEEVEFLYKYAKANNLLVSCGTDYHSNKKDSIACSYLTEEMIQDVLSWIK